MTKRQTIPNELGPTIPRIRLQIDGGNVDNLTFTQYGKGSELSFEATFFNTSTRRTKAVTSSLNREQVGALRDFLAGWLMRTAADYPATQDQSDFVDAMRHLNPIIGEYAADCVMTRNADPRAIKTGLEAAADLARGWCTGRFG